MFKFSFGRLTCFSSLNIQISSETGRGKEHLFFAANEETGRSLMQANVNLLYRSTRLYTLSEAARFKLDWFLKLSLAY